MPSLSGGASDTGDAGDVGDAAISLATQTLSAQTLSASTKPNTACHFPFPLNCGAWPTQTQGTFKHFDHILLANAQLWESGVPNCTDGLLARVFARIYAKDEASLPAPTNAQILAFIEPNLAGTVT